MNGPCEFVSVNSSIIVSDILIEMEPQVKRKTAACIKRLFSTTECAPFKRWVVRLVKVGECYECQKQA